ncbi:carboxymethylenebutenolidase [Intrasporangium chromatireducens Q5-1]|uniref:Carboxymethylenebutenolidase n=1 Tax=Intrasporangium chromatireducens Q5-1 TaxID=584657 RepID=W9GHG4_9MICO|nr:dienelactone hydrolase family protein [Intrasporangium chromatireducens]EWT05671.1 carboxymethylenebutenolidase [Intrasporangium chromatireducens Q5-1]
MSERVHVPTESGEMPAQLWLPAAGTGPGIVLCQEIFGLSPYVVQRAEDLAALGYVVLAPEFFWRLGVSTVSEQDGGLERGIALANQLDWPLTVRDGVAAVQWLRERDEVTGPVGLLGFCFGGGLAFNVAAKEPVSALVSYYGSALPMLLELAPRVTAPSLHHFGTADSFIDQESVAKVRAAVTASPATVFHEYEGADHAFDNPDLPWHHPDASVLAWDRTVAFLQEHLPVGS